MSSISSCDSYQISVENEDEPYIKRLNELEEEHSGSDSSTDNYVEKTKNMKTELELVSLYLKCKKVITTPHTINTKHIRMHCYWFH